MQYIPGWWDSIRGSATGFTNDLLRTINPGAFAQNDFNEMVKKNPMILSQIGGMEPDAKAAFAQAFRFKDGNNPIQGIGPNVAMRGALQNEGMVNQGMAADPEGVLARATGARTSEDKQVDALKPDIAQNQVAQGAQNLEAGAQNMQLTRQNLAAGSFKLEDLERTSGQISAAFDEFPDLAQFDIGKLARQAVRGELNPQLMTRIANDQGAAPLFELAKDVEIAKLTSGLIENRMRLTAGTRDANLTIQTLDKATDNNKATISELRMLERQALEKDRSLVRYLQNPEGYQGTPPNPESVQNVLGIRERLQFEMSRRDRLDAAMDKALGMETPLGKKNQDGIIRAIQEGKGTLEEFLNDPNFSDTDKQLVSARLKRIQEESSVNFAPSGINPFQRD